MDSEYEQDRQDTLRELAQDMVVKGHHRMVLSQLRSEIPSEDFAELRQYVEALLHAQSLEDYSINGKG